MFSRIAFGATRAVRPHTVRESKKIVVRSASTAGQKINGEFSVTNSPNNNMKG